VKQFTHSAIFLARGSFKEAISLQKRLILPDDLGRDHRAVPVRTHIDLPAAAAGTHQPLAPIEYGRFGAI